MFMMFLSSFYASFFFDHQRGWHWYERGDELEESTEKEKKADQKKTPSEVIKIYKKELEDKLAKALIHPTETNIKAYQAMQKDMFDRSQRFSDVWMKTVFQNPDLDHTLVAPVNQQARHIYLDLEKEKIKRSIQELSKDYGLFFFFSSGCRYCASFAPIVKQLSVDYGWDVLAIRTDAGALKEFPNAIQDNGLSETWNVQVLPALFAVNPHTQHVIPLAHGMTARDQIETRLMTLLKVSK